MEFVNNSTGTCNGMADLLARKVEVSGYAILRRRSRARRFTRGSSL